MDQTILHDYHGEQLSLSDIELRSGTKKKTIISRMSYYDITAEEAADMPPIRQGTFDYHGRRVRIGEVEQQTGISRFALYRRMQRKGCTLEEAVAMGPDMRVKRTPERSSGDIALSVFALALFGENQHMKDAAERAKAFGFREEEPGVFRFQTDSYTFRIDVEEHTAQLTGWFRRTGMPSIRRAYTIKGDRLKEHTDIMRCAGTQACV